MRHRKQAHAKDPRIERAEIGTPAGESPEEGRRRHGTECLTDVCEPPIPSRSRKPVDEEISEEGIPAEEEINPGGGLTGTKVKGGVPAGGAIEEDTAEATEEA